MNWLTHWLRRGISFTMDPPRFLDGSKDKCGTCKTERYLHEGKLHIFAEGD